MKFTSFASSSRGNAYLLQSDGVSPLLLEAGLPIKQLRDKLRERGVSLSDLAGCLVSHGHQDHSKAVKDALKVGVDVGMSKQSAEVLGVQNHHRVFILEPEVQKRIGVWTILPFPAVHDIPCLGFVIGYEEERLLYITDSAYSEHRFSGLTHIMIEANYIEDILSKNILEGNLPPIVGRRVRRNHLSLENLVAMLKANDLSKCREIHLLHLSDGNSDEQLMRQKVEAATGIPTYALK